MKTVTSEEIARMGISPRQCIDWVEESLRIKHLCQLPVKTSVHPQGRDFITTMPCMLHPESRTFGVKVVSRIEGRKPSLKSSLTLYDTVTGEITALMDADWITAMRTGAMAALAIRTLRAPDARVYALMGLGQIGHAVMKCLAEVLRPGDEVKLLRYKDQAERFAEEFPDIRFTIVDGMEAFVEGSDVVISAITSADGLLVDSPGRFKPGCLLVPVHTRGFQNCDTVFDKVVGDDTDHLRGFRYFNEFRSFCELSDVLLGRAPGRATPADRIIAYNYGLALHDIYFAYRIREAKSEARSAQVRRVPRK